MNFFHIKCNESLGQLLKLHLKILHIKRGMDSHFISMILIAQWKSIRHQVNGLWVQAPSGGVFLKNQLFFYNFKSCPRDSFHFFFGKFYLNINLELILHNISCGVREILSFWCHEKSTSNLPTPAYIQGKHNSHKSRISGLLSWKILVCNAVALLKNFMEKIYLVETTPQTTTRHLIRHFILPALNRQRNRA